MHFECAGALPLLEGFYAYGLRLKLALPFAARKHFVPWSTFPGYLALKDTQPPARVSPAVSVCFTIRHSAKTHLQSSIQDRRHRKLASRCQYPCQCTSTYGHARSRRHLREFNGLQKRTLWRGSRRVEAPFG